MGKDGAGWYWFREVGSDEVRPKIQEAAARTLAYVESDLSLPGLRVRWFRLVDGMYTKADVRAGSWGQLQSFDTPRTLRGRVVPFFEPGVLWVRCTLPACSVIEVVAHEARHLWQLEHWDGPLKYDDSHAERDADVYSIQAWASLSRITPTV